MIGTQEGGAGFGYAVDSLAAWLSGSPAPGAFPITVAIVACWMLPLLLCVFPLASLGQILERKIAAAIQRREGPNSAGLDGPLRLAFRILLFWKPRDAQDRAFARFCEVRVVSTVLRVGRRLGLGQLVADGVKMLGKEDIVPAGTDGLVFRLAPYLALVGAFLPFCVVPFTHHLVMLESGTSTLFAIACAGITVLALKMAGWGSGSKWSLLGGMRAVAQLVSYEIPVGLAVAGVVLWCGTLDLHAITAQQYHPGVFSLLGWNALQNPFLMLLAGVLFFAGLAECQRTPFDMAEAESELVSGFNTEYSGLRWGMFALAEYAEMVLVGALLVTLFFGGYQSPIGEQWIVGLPVWLETILHAACFGAKVIAVFLTMMWIRWTLPRLRVDQVMRLCWLQLVPLCLVSLLGIALVMLAADGAEPGPAYGRLPSRPRVDLGIVGHLVAWAAPLAVGALLVRAARRKYGPMHPALLELTAEKPAGGAR